MTIEDGHFRTDGKTIEACCKRMDRETEYMESIVLNRDETYNIYCNDAGVNVLSHVTFCPFCGAKLEYAKTLIGENQ